MANPRDLGDGEPVEQPPGPPSPPSPTYGTGTVNDTIDALYFEHLNMDEFEGEGISTDVLALFDELDEQLRRAAVAPKPSQPVPTQPFPFLRLPLELREQVYAEYFDPKDRLDVDMFEGMAGRYSFEFGLLRTCRQVWLEALRMWRKNVFVRLETPWPTAVHHISSEGQVPIVAAGARADNFNHHTATVQLTAPMHSVTVTQHTIILLLEDLPLFTKVWYYSALSYPNLNSQIRLTFSLRDPYDPADPRPVPSALQKQLLLPFGLVKGLYETEFEGYDERIVAELLKSMAIPYPTLQEACESATALMEAGDRLLAENHAQEALDTYVKSFDAIHVKITGRNRTILADGFFHHDITTGRYSGQSGMVVRVILRIRLVSRVCLAYLHLHQPEETAFWGMRSIRIMGDTRDTQWENFFAGFVGSSDVGLIHARTAIGFALMERDGGWATELEMYKEDEAGSTQLWEAAGRYLKGAGREAERKRVVGEARQFGVRVPAEAGFGPQTETSDVDSMSHLNLGSAEDD